MVSNDFTLSPNILERYIGKSSREFTKADLTRFIEEKGVSMVNFHYIPEDGRLKTLNFVINSKEHLDEILTYGERVDGSSLFSYIRVDASDLYIVPKYSTAFMNVFSEIPNLSFLCSFFDHQGNFYDASPHYLITKARKRLEEETGYVLEAMGELEYYIITPKMELFRPEDQRAYHESEPFNKTSEFRREAMRIIAQCGGKIKYAHAEVGSFDVGDKHYEQNEIEFLPVPLEDAADQLVIAKWILRNLAYQKGIHITFSPKITVGKAGSGLHVHLKLMKDGKNIVLRDGQLSDDSKKAIAGVLDMAPSLTAFGNTNPSSYFRLVPHQEAPTTICWGFRNRAVLVRVPLLWDHAENMILKVNEREPGLMPVAPDKQTFEFRVPDGSANVHMLIAALTLAVLHGLTMENGLEKAESLFYSPMTLKDREKLKSFDVLPASCFASGAELAKQRLFYEHGGVFPAEVIDRIIAKLESYNDVDLISKLERNVDGLLELVDKYFHCG